MTFNGLNVYLYWYVQVPYQLRIELVALTQQAKLGSFQKAEADLPPLGTFDIIGKERRAAWEVLGDMDKDEAKAQFLAKLMLAAPTFEEFIATKTEQRRLEEQKKAEEAKKSAEEAAAKALREEERQVEEVQRRAIQVFMELFSSLLLAILYILHLMITPSLRTP